MAGASPPPLVRCSLRGVLLEIGQWALQIAAVACCQRAAFVGLITGAYARMSGAVSFENLREFLVRGWKHVNIPHRSLATACERLTQCYAAVPWPRRYYPARYANVVSWCEVCACANAKLNRGRWVHPVGELKPRLRVDHPIVSERLSRLGGERKCLVDFPRCPKRCDARRKGTVATEAGEGDVFGWTNTAAAAQFVHRDRDSTKVGRRTNGRT